MKYKECILLNIKTSIYGSTEFLKFNSFKKTLFLKEKSALINVAKYFEELVELFGFFRLKKLADVVLLISGQKRVLRKFNTDLIKIIHLSLHKKTSIPLRETGLS